MESIEHFISTATMQNWDRLHTININEKLISRANKKLSSKQIIPIEYFTNTDNVNSVMDLAEFITDNHFAINNVIYTLAMRLLKQEDINLDKANVKDWFYQYSYCSTLFELDDFVLPDDEKDLLGLIYQCLKTEGNKNRGGSYYTPSFIAKELLSGLDFTLGQIFLDPSCGSSNLLLNIETAKPQQLFGVDIDPVAVMISKINLIMKYRNYDFTPNIFCMDFLNMNSLFSPKSIFNSDIKFDYIITNPPWGAGNTASKDNFPQIYSGESFSYFIVQSMKELKKDGILRYLLPEAFLNVRAHKDIRKFLLDNFCIEQLKTYSDVFTGVTTKFIDIKVRNTKPKNVVIINDNQNIYTMPIINFKASSNSVYCLLNSEDLKILNLAYKRDYETLKNSIWALGIVTGDNKNKLSKTKKDGWQPIWTGKEIQPYRLLPFKNYILYDRQQLQQTAKDDIYRSPEKLVYKFISNRLKFAYDNSGGLFLNSANIVIPKIEGMNIKTVLSFLNSELFQFIYIKKFGEIKILQGNLCELPFAKISESDNKHFAKLTDKILAGDLSVINLLQDTVYDFYNISQVQKEYIKGVICGKTLCGIKKRTC
ncbi:MAG: N-6 DNA methylase [Elusimicrobiota bacterium]|jgi:methylase of polypeptide subunit release factors|nr:N-6 DNA methylase [Elusimicrobiota bacterium]